MVNTRKATDILAAEMNEELLQRKTRRPKFKKMEIDVLLEEISKRSALFTSKNDPAKGVTERKKLQAWDEIADTFNSTAFTKRSPAELRRKFRDLKHSTKAKAEAENRLKGNKDKGALAEIKYSPGEMEMLKLLPSIITIDQQDTKQNITSIRLSARESPSPAAAANDTTAAAATDTTAAAADAFATAAAATAASQPSTSRPQPSHRAPKTATTQPNATTPSITTESLNTAQNNHVYTTIIIGEGKPYVPVLNQYGNTTDLRPVTSLPLQQTMSVDQTNITIPPPHTAPTPQRPSKGSHTKINESRPSSRSSSSPETLRAGPEVEIGEVVDAQNDIRDLLQELVGIARQMVSSQENIANAINSLANAVASQRTYN